MNRQILALWVLLVTSVAPLGAQETARDRARAALPPESFQVLESLAAEAAREGIPQDPLFNKALEGIAKRVPPDRLLPAVTEYAARLRTAHQAFGGSATGPLLVAGADAIRRGVGAETLRNLSERGHHSPMAVLVLAELVEAGVSSGRALAVLQEAMRMRMREKSVLDIPGQVRRLMREGHSPQEAADQIRRGLQRGRHGGGGMFPPVPPGSEPVTRERRKGGPKRGGGSPF
jgi:hypothetical protein